MDPIEEFKQERRRAIADMVQDEELEEITGLVDPF